MIDSSEHFSALTKMIERLAAGEHEQWAVWAQNILDTEPRLSENRKARWPGLIATPYDELSEEHKDWDRREVYLRSGDALAEIERLRALPVADVAAYDHRIQEMAARIAELEADVLQKSLLCDSIVENCNSLRDRARKAEARIEGLENALSEYQRLGKTIAGRLPCLVLHGDCGRCSAGAREVCGALEQIAEGKIGPDVGVAHKECKECSDERLLASLVEHENQTHAILGAILGTDDTLENVAKRAMARIAELEKWLKKERSARLLEKSGSILLVYLKENEIDFDEFFDGKALEHLRAEGKIGPGTVAPPCWQITEERVEALHRAIRGLSDPNFHHSNVEKETAAVLRAMLKEAE